MFVFWTTWTWLLISYRLGSVYICWYQSAVDIYFFSICYLYFVQHPWSSLKSRSSQFYIFIVTLVSLESFSFFCFFALLFVGIRQCLCCSFNVFNNVNILTVLLSLVQDNKCCNLFLKTFLRFCGLENALAWTTLIMELYIVLLFSRNKLHFMSICGMLW